MAIDDDEAYSPSELKRTRVQEEQSLLREENGEGREWWYVVEGEENDKGNNQTQVGWQKRVARPGERGKVNKEPLRS
ncbi:hypothetical protein PHLCEN_2v2828 [Hermanssonia centrifuga]|uniref:Uncharacterized protein n=1 Tax=Hermanssonia centrifuga TaxID=98765 RepID=A0A2R6RI10_9APHY|nr:hypothetical protein PHLCEN_2v2828 [Hermanssonia centrifuga]